MFLRVIVDQCSVDFDCKANEVCRGQVCVCDVGYEQGDAGCVGRLSWGQGYNLAHEQCRFHSV